MAEKIAFVVKPHIGGLDEYVDKVKEMARLLNEASSIYEDIKDAVFEVDYSMESATLNACPQDGHSPSPDDMGTVAPHIGH